MTTRTGNEVHFRRPGEGMACGVRTKPGSYARNDATTVAEDVTCLRCRRTKAFNAAAKPTPPPTVTGNYRPSHYGDDTNTITLPNGRTVVVRD